MKNTITGVGGDTLKVRRYVKNIDPTDLLTKAWLTVKADLADADPGVVQKSITTTYSPGNGQIVDAGATDGKGEILFELTAQNTADIESTGVYYDIQLKTAAGALYTFELGTVNFRADVTQSVT
jgi:hypothetical protein